MQARASGQISKVRSLVTWEGPAGYRSLRLRAEGQRAAHPSSTLTGKRPEPSDRLQATTHDAQPMPAASISSRPQVMMVPGHDLLCSASFSIRRAPNSDVTSRHVTHRQPTPVASPTLDLPRHKTPGTCVLESRSEQISPYRNFWKFLDEAGIIKMSQRSLLSSCD